MYDWRGTAQRGGSSAVPRIDGTSFCFKRTFGMRLGHAIIHRDKRTVFAKAGLCREAYGAPLKWGASL